MMFEIAQPTDRASIAAAAEGQGAEIETFFAALPEGEFFAPQGDFWSPADHLRHLVKSVRPIALALRMPRLVLALRFGWRRRGSRSYRQVVDLYQAALEAGGGAGRFAPSSVAPDLAPSDWRRQILAQWRSAGADLVAGLGRWSEPALDRHLLPHPLLGKLTVREMLFFTLYHNAHHGRRVVERQGRADQEVIS